MHQEESQKSKKTLHVSSLATEAGSSDMKAETQHSEASKSIDYIPTMKTGLYQKGLFNLTKAQTSPKRDYHTN